jgi:hypothetical protein
MILPVLCLVKPYFRKKVNSLMPKKSENSRKSGRGVENRPNPNVPEKRDRRWQVYMVTKEDRDNLRQLGPAIGCADRYDALNRLAAVVKKMKAQDLIQPPKKYRVKLGLPPALDAALHEKSEELGCVITKLLLSAVRVMIEKSNKKQKRQKAVADETPAQTPRDSSKDASVKTPRDSSKDASVKTPRGSLKDASAETPDGTLKEAPPKPPSDEIRSIWLD